MNKSVSEVVSLIEERTGYRFKNENYLLEALTHSSYTNEMKINKRNCYERLEFLGDAVLEMISSEFLFNTYPNDPEGVLSKTRASMVCEPSLAICARRMNLGELIFFGKGEELAGGRERDSILCDVTEAILGAIYLDSGIEDAKAYVMAHILKDLKKEDLFNDYKTLLQERIYKEKPGSQIAYNILSQSGPEHEKVFEAEVVINGIKMATGKGSSKKAAHQAAAFAAMKALDNN
ncbi:MAG: ribonuclease III [Lachnospiraceae bacterium]|nr:ribonuclease III [Lachnospiraceae bacterium]